LRVFYRSIVVSIKAVRENDMPEVLEMWLKSLDADEAREICDFFDDDPEDAVLRITEKLSETYGA
jgi:translation initiation factor 2 alpha subunit (eIF-2alpha)